jgi:hypothetical protein
MIRELPPTLRLSSRLRILLLTTITSCGLLAFFVTHVPIQIIMNTCSHPLFEQLIAEESQRQYVSGVSMRPHIEPPPTLIRMTADTYRLTGEATLTIGYTPPNSFDDSNGPERDIVYQYACLVQYTGAPWVGIEAQVHVLEITTQRVRG